MRTKPDWYRPAWGGVAAERKVRKVSAPSKRRADPEHRFQRQLVVAVRKAAPHALFASIPNGGNRHMLTAVKLKAEGALAGAPDLFFVLDGGRVAFLELKSRSGRVTPEQAAFRDKARERGALWEVAKDFDAAWSVLADWGVVQLVQVAPFEPAVRS